MRLLFFEKLLDYCEILIERNEAEWIIMYYHSQLSILNIEQLILSAIITPVE